MNRVEAVKDKIAKLPQWAQQLIDVLGRDVEYWKGRATAGPEESDTFAYNRPDWTSMGFSAKPLGVGEKVLFRVQDRKGRDEWIEVFVVNGKLRVSGGSEVYIKPQAANSFMVEVAR